MHLHARQRSMHGSGREGIAMQGSSGKGKLQACMTFAGIASVVQYVQDVLFGCTRQNAIRTVQPVQNGGLYGVIIKASIPTYIYLI
eukprot:350755-Chlamydomonas_euryale.AAC.1